MLTVPFSIGSHDARPMLVNAGSWTVNSVQMIVPTSTSRPASIDRCTSGRVVIATIPAITPTATDSPTAMR